MHSASTLKGQSVIIFKEAYCKGVSDIKCGYARLKNLSYNLIVRIPVGRFYSRSKLSIYTDKRIL